MKKILFALTMLFALTACGPNYSNGDRVGTVSKLSNKGLIFRSWEGQLIQGGMMNKTDSEGKSSLVANTLEFNVQDPEVVKQLQDAMNTGKRVKLTYTEWAIAPITIENSYVITSVTVLD